MLRIYIGIDTKNTYATDKVVIAVYAFLQTFLTYLKTEYKIKL